MECPKCGNNNIAKILYGLPAFDEKMERDLQDGHIVLGGCEEDESNHHWHCNACKTEF